MTGRRHTPTLGDEVNELKDRVWELERELALGAQGQLDGVPVIVAAYNAPTFWIKRAHFLCTGIDDDVQIMSALQFARDPGLTGNAYVLLSPGNFQPNINKITMSNGDRMDGCGIDCTFVQFQGTPTVTADYGIASTNVVTLNHIDFLTTTDGANVGTVLRVDNSNPGREAPNLFRCQFHASDRFEFNVDMFGNNDVNDFQITDCIFSSGDLDLTTNSNASGDQTRTHIVGNRFDDSSIINTLGDWNAGSIVNNTFTGTSRIDLDGSLMFHRGRIANNYFDEVAAGAGDYVIKLRGTSVTQHLITGNMLYNCTGDGGIFAGHNCTVSGNRVHGTFTEAGIRLSGRDGSESSGNVVNGNRVAAGGPVGILFQANSSNNNHDNTCIANVIEGATEACIKFVLTTIFTEDFARNFVVFNSSDDTATYGIFDDTDAGGNSGGGDNFNYDYGNVFPNVGTYFLSTNNAADWIHGPGDADWNTIGSIGGIDITDAANNTFLTDFDEDGDVEFAEVQGAVEAFLLAAVPGPHARTRPDVASHEATMARHFLYGSG